MARAWFAYAGTGSTTAAGNYVHVPASSLECTGFGTICAIYAYYSPGSGGIVPSNPNSPLTNGILSYINTANVGSTDLPQGSSKKYLYVKQN